jgi:hypothetical protein
LKEIERETDRDRDRERSTLEAIKRSSSATKLLALSHTLCVCCKKTALRERECVCWEALGQQGSARAAQSVATARVVLLLATLVPEPSQRGMKEGRKKGSGARAGGWDGTGGQTAGRTPLPFHSFPFFPFSRVILKREVAEVSLAGSVVCDGCQEAIINPTDVDG